VWVAPYLGGNFIGGFYLPFAPAYALGFAIAVLAVTKHKTFRADWFILRKRVYAYLKICVIAGLAGIIAVYMFAGFIEQWRQIPSIRVLNATCSEALRWLLLIAPITLATRKRFSQKLVRHAIFAGLFYCALGFVQFGVERVFSYDLFPIARGSVGETGFVSQSTMAYGFDSRITSICGEPRYLAAFCCLWFLLILALGRHIGFSATRRGLIAGIYLLTIILTGSRSGLLILLAVGIVVSVVAVYIGRLRVIVSLLSIGLLVGIIFAAIITTHSGSFGTRNNIDIADETTLAVGGVNVPVEWGEIARFSEITNHPWQLLIGAGPGLWQYYVNPWDYQFVNTYYSEIEGKGLDSVRSNFQIISRLCDVGLIGLIAMVALLVALYRYGKSGVIQLLRNEYYISFFMFVTLIQVPGAADYLSYLMVGVVVQVYLEIDVSG
jgi:hypothetical protein